jgi:hypothetical protein
MMERESICELNESKYKFPFLVVGGDWVCSLCQQQFGLLHRPRVPRVMGDEECDVFGGLIGKGKRSIHRKHTPASSCTPQIPQDLNRAWTRASVVVSQQLTAWGTAGFHTHDIAHSPSAQDAILHNCGYEAEQKCECFRLLTSDFMERYKAGRNISYCYINEFSCRENDSWLRNHETTLLWAANGVRYRGRSSLPFACLAAGWKSKRRRREGQSALPNLILSKQIIYYFLHFCFTIISIPNDYRVWNHSFAW